MIFFIGKNISLICRGQLTQMEGEKSSYFKLRFGNQLISKVCRFGLCFSMLSNLYTVKNLITNQPSAGFLPH